MASDYLVLARKYRPQTFEEMVGQEHVTRTLANAITRGRLHHAFLFAGARGVGKTTAARILAKALCCEQGPTATPCNECGACREIRGGTAIDVIEIDGASNNGVDHVRDLREAARYQPAHLRRKVYILDEVHMLSSGAFNALLKTLEEPPPHVTFVFATTESHKIPITILSRCQRYDFKLLSGDRLRAHLEGVLVKEGLAAEAGAVGLIVREAGGSVRDALSLLDQVIAYAGGEPLSETRVASALGVADRGVLFDLARAVLARDPGAALTTLDAACERGYELLPLGRAFLGLLRDLSLARRLPNPAPLLDASPSEVEEIVALAREAPEGVLPLLFDRTARALEESARSNVPRLLFEMALLDLVAVEPLVPLGDLLARLEELEGRLVSADASRTPGGPVGGGGAGRPSPRRREVEATSAPSQPPPPAAPSLAGVNVPATATEGSLMARWEGVLRRLESSRPSLAAQLAMARLLTLTAERCELAASGALASFIDDAENRKLLAEAVASELGGRPSVRIVVEEGDATAVASVGAGESLAGLEQRRRAERRDQKEREARAHPLVKAALATFGAEIKEVKPLDAEGE